MKTNKPKYNHDSGFKIPEDYFSSLEDRIMHRFNELESEIPAKQNDFKVPEGYFDSLEDKIISRANINKPGIIRLFKREYFYYAAAVVAICILMLGNYFSPLEDPSIGWDDVEISAMENYIDEDYNMGYVEWNTSEYSDYIFSDSKIIYDEDFETVDSDAVLDYLDENIEDPTYILE